MLYIIILTSAECSSKQIQLRGHCYCCPRVGGVTVTNVFLRRAAGRISRFTTSSIEIGIESLYTDWPSLGRVEDWFKKSTYVGLLLSISTMDILWLDQWLKVWLDLEGSTYQSYSSLNFGSLSPRCRLGAWQLHSQSVLYQVFYYSWAFPEGK